jgi:hypothetical protein
MQVYDSQDDMEKKEYRPAKDERGMQAAWYLILDPRPLVHELGSISLETVRKALYKLNAHNFEAPEGFTLGRDVLLLSVIIGEPRQCKTKVLSEVLKSLGVFEGAGAYYVVIDTSLDRPTLHAGACIEEGLEESVLTIAALVREQAPLDAGAYEQTEQEIELKLAHFAKHLEREEREERDLAFERERKLLEDAWSLRLAEIQDQAQAFSFDVEYLNHLVNKHNFIVQMYKPSVELEVWASRARYVQDLSGSLESEVQA